MLLSTTEKLLEECDACWQRFLRMREEDTSPDFFLEVKPHADTWHAILVTWQSESEKWILLNKPKYMHNTQIDNALDAMDQFVVQSFYKATSKKRFYQSIQSVKYTLETFLRYLREDGEQYASEKND
ncbi:YppE family protein [Viridibacillus sp. FSL R5-0477]|uniref:DUF1798 family protein n=1 Tax=Viridibacillus arenosi FSL R5-213 TaxID=1227360 RepID=W4EMV0_9BACL|nr:MULTISPECIES: YppE family protein [Viridibacillus]ETT81111.1 hypothetical protein C176_20434 [Viridibacillus arenosi FSL R5-213]OMC84061.1 hypothetical protein BK130_06065 [Viridibacillus sp. FSL H8-0123]OMC88583.1 hypothetical protein BK128_01185 [Viridibacillus sp. FSL H7-0596]OMC93216.1 hypothetical protein BK137_01480 [Viridibacillus arenosi]